MIGELDLLDHGLRVRNGFVFGNLDRGDLEERVIGHDRTSSMTFIQHGIRNGNDVIPRPINDHVPGHDLVDVTRGMLLVLINPLNNGAKAVKLREHADKIVVIVYDTYSGDTVFEDDVHRLDDRSAGVYLDWALYHVSVERN